MKFHFHGRNELDSEYLKLKASFDVHAFDVHMCAHETLRPGNP